jgi:TonB family protein
VWTDAIVAALPASFGVNPYAPIAAADVVVRADGIEPASGMGRIFLVLWTSGALAVLLKLGADAVRLARMARTATPVAGGAWLAAARDASAALGVTRPYRLLGGAGAMPMTWGIWPARVLVPAGPVNWSHERRQVVLAHELAHVTRMDWLVLVAAEICCAVYWFNPLFWVARRALWRESEQACDDMVLGLGIAADEYAAHLLDIARTARVPAQPSLAIARRSGLERRFAALLDVTARRTTVDRATAWAAMAATLLFVSPLAAIHVPEAATTVDVQTANLPLALESAPIPNGPGAAAAIPRVRLVPTASRARLTTAPDILEYTTPPLYSEDARTRRAEGTVTVQAVIDAAGRVGEARVVKGLGFGLDQNAVVALRQWRFRPGSVDGQPAATLAEIDIEFSLRHEALNELIANDMATRVGPGVTPPRAVHTVGVGPSGVATGRVTRTGTVVLDVVLLEDGVPRIVRILQSVDPELDDRAVRAFEQWRFSPATKDGRPVKVRLNAAVRFRG